MILDAALNASSFDRAWPAKTTKSGSDLAMTFVDVEINFAGSL
jgi:hypothetical protein